MKNKTCGLYIHIPFCVRKCAYCDFLSFSADDTVKKDYTEALIREIELRASVYCDYRITSVFFGGGTPTVLPAESLKAICEAVKTHFEVDPDAEITMEMNPGTDREELDEILAHEVNRVSVGLQSFKDEELQTLGRIHSTDDFLKTYEHLRRIGVKNINIDLMAALPHQTLRSWEKTLRRAAALKPEHISAYSLIVEAGTPFARLYTEGEAPLPDEETERSMYELTDQILHDEGYHRYEISNYAREGYESCHNRLYWACREYLGVGLGAASYMNNRRFRVTDSLDQYLEMPSRDAIEGILSEETLPAMLYCEKEELTLLSRMEEFMFMGLRLTEGVSAKEFEHRFGMTLDACYGHVLKRHIREGLMTRTAKGYALTKRGLDISNMVMADFIIETSHE